MSKLFTTKLLRDEPWGQSSVDSITGTVSSKIWCAGKKEPAVVVVVVGVVVAVIVVAAI